MKKEKRVIELTRINTNKFSVFFVYFVVLLFFSCSFDYGDLEPVESTMPDLVMENVDYVRVRSSAPQARFQADRAERYENQRIMLLENITFEQFGTTIEEINAQGSAANATIQIDSGDILMNNGVSIEVESEDIVLETTTLEWIDEPKTLVSGREDEVAISMSTGSTFAGTGFFADAGRRTWEFLGNVNGTYIAEDLDDEEDTHTEAQRHEEEAETETGNLESVDENI